MTGLLAGCSGWLGGNEAPPLPGERISVLALQSTVQPDLELSDQRVILPEPEPMVDWPQNGGIPSHALHHVGLDNDVLKQDWSVGIGDGSMDDNLLLNQAIIARGVIFTIDASAEVRAFAATSGKRIWSLELTPEDEEDSTLLGGGLAYEQGIVYATTGFAEVVAIDAPSATVLWRTQVSAPMRSAPTVRGGRVFVITVDNQTIALNAMTGETLWNHRGASEGASFIGGASPAVDQGVVISAYSTGEMYALRVENGQVIWSDALAGAGRTDAVSAIADIRGLPVIDDDLVIATSNAGLTVAIDLRTGYRVWELEAGGIQSPWVAGDYVYLLTNTNDLIALRRKTGQVKWVTVLPRFVDPEDQEEPIVWTGPVLVGDRLIVGNEQGEVMTVSPYSGDILGKDEVSGPITLPPSVAGDSLYFLTADADLIAYR
ncbi:PQQ-binding-like beta-propeller repeat protein [Thalassospira sp. FZY0004]|uniref:PQQ-binding-like beta-propeller repeat protein n=2 Tax=Thalassospira aquimaris TaxID=3037796 RepID=A0ABT6GGK8_9PROT|nr:PQQ-like beta-propeller repeat protein [Thalassospira profundimaris]MDG4721212.1 PQQ-binding-like beta-propeller repeat protein [Thalassospira sp. FZY0004]